MKKKTMRFALAAAMFGSVVQFGGCLSSGIWQDILLNAATELVWDSTAILDFFGDDGPGLFL